MNSRHLQSISKPGAIIIEGHVQGLSNTRALGELGVPVFVLDRHSCLARYSKYCSGFYKCPEYSSEGLIEFLVKFSQEKDLRKWILVPSNDHALRNIVDHHGILAPYYNLATLPSLETLETIYDKVKLISLANKTGVHAPKTYPDILNLSAASYPVIIKGRNGLTFYKKLGRKAFIASDDSSYKEAVSKVSDSIPSSDAFAQEIIPEHEQNSTISFAAFAINGEMKSYWMGEKIRQHPLNFGTATFCKSVDEHILVEPSKSLIKALAYTGVCEIEYLLDPRDGKHKLIEINARTWLWVGLAKACGIGFTQMLYDYANDHPITPDSGGKLGYKWINFLTDTPYALYAIIVGKLSFHKYLSSFKGKLVKACFSWKDMIPAILFPFILIIFSKKRRN